MKNIWKLMGVSALALGVAGFVACQPKENPTGDVLTAPTGLNAVPTSDGATLNWDKVAGATGYKVQVDNGREQGPFGTNSRKVQGLQPETEHTWRVRAVANGVDGPWSNEESFTTLELVLPAVTGLVYEGLIYNSVALFWDVTEGQADTYIVKIQGAQFSDTVNPEFISNLGDGRKEFKVEYETARFDPAIWGEGYFGQQFPILAKETAYTWSVGYVKNGKEGDWANGEGFTTPQPVTPYWFPYSKLLGNYGVAGAPSWFEDVSGPSSWNGSLVQAYYNVNGQSVATEEAYLMFNPFDLVNVGPQRFTNMPASEFENKFGAFNVNFGDGKLYLDDTHRIAAYWKDQAKTSAFALIIVGITPNGNLFNMGQNLHELKVTDYNTSTPKITFPTRIEAANSDVLYGIALGTLDVNSGEITALENILTDFYTNITMTYTGAGTRGMSFSGTPVLKREDIKIKYDAGQFPVKSSNGGMFGGLSVTSKYAQTVSNARLVSYTK